MIRYAKPADHAAIEAVVQAAFGREDEARLVNRLREDEDAAFELVAEQAGVVVGHILFSRLWVDRYDLYAALAPLAVHPTVQRAGLGSALVRSGLECAREFGVAGVLVLGDPAYYRRFGFAAEITAQIKSPYQRLAAFQGVALEENAFDGPMSVTYPDAFRS